MLTHRVALIRACFLLFAFCASSLAAAAPSPNIVISQVYGGGGNTGSVYKNDFIELFNRGSAAQNVSGWSVQYASATGTSWAVTNLTNVTIQPGQYYLVQQAVGAGGTTNLPTPDATGTIAMSGTAGKVALSSTVTALTGTCPTGGNLVDFVGFGTTPNCFEGTGPTPAPSNTASVSRAAAGCTDTDSNTLDFSAAAANPRNTSSPLSPCAGGVTPTVNLSLSTNAASEAAQTVVTITATASAPVSGEQSVMVAISGSNITSGDYTLSSTAISFAPGGTVGTATFTVVDDGIAEGPETATITLTNPSAGITLGTASANVTIADSSPAPITRIHAVQGSGTASPLVGQTVTIEGIVTASFQTTGIAGFFVQEEDVNADADPLTSEGVFVFHSATPVVEGDKVRVTGTVVEFGTAPATLTEITAATVSILSTGNPLPAAVTVTLPVAVLGDLERFEGMRVTTAQTLTVSQNFALARFGELTLSANGRLPQPSNFIDPNDATASGTTSSGTSNVAAISAQVNLNLRSSILLADTTTTQNVAVIPFLDPVDKTLRTGSTVSGLSGILTQSFGVHAIHPTTPPVFAYAPRPLTPPTVGGALKVASFNVLNFFNGDGAGGGFPTSRGANTPLEFSRQKAKTIAALCGLGADVVGLMEMENDATTAAPALNELAAALSTTSGCGTWGFVANPANWGSFPGSTDEIRPALIYRSTAVTPVGAAMSPNDAAFTQARAPVAQTFRVISGASTGAKLSVIVNHFKSKGSGGTGADADQGDGQGFYNNARKLQASALLSFITTVQTAANDPDVLVIGDLNAYSEEDPIDILRAGGLVKLDSDGYSYVFDAQTGSLDHALATPSLVAQITNTGVWHINADEPIILDYNVEFKNTTGCTTTCTSPDYYAPTPFRSSDHDPVLIGMALVATQLSLTPTPQSVGTVVIGGSPVDRTLTLANSTAQSGSLTAINVTGTGYARNGGTCPTVFPAIIAANGSCTVIVRFTATVVGTPTGGVDVTGDATATATLNATVVAALTTTSASANGVVGTQFSFALTATGGSAPYTWSIASGTLPAGVTLIGSTVAGTPTAVGSGTTTFSVTDGSGQTAALVLSYSITAAPVATFTLDTASQSFGTVVTGSAPVDRTLTLSSAAPASASQGDYLKLGEIGPAANGNLTAITVSGAGFVRNGGTCPTAFPATLAFGTSCTIVIRFTPTTVGTSAGSVTITGDSTATAALGATVVAALTTSPRALTAVTGTAFNFALVANGGTAPFIWTITSGTLPAGLTLVGSSISGTPTAAGFSAVTLQVADSSGQIATVNLSFSVTAAVVAAAALPVPGLDGLSLLWLSLILALGSGVLMRRR